MNNRIVSNLELKQLAKLLAQEESIDKKVHNFIMNKLPKSSLKTLIQYLRRELDKREVRVKIANEITDQEVKLLKKIFQDKKLVVEEDPSLGGGIFVKDGDDLIDMSLKSYINQTVNKLKTTL